MTTNNPLGRATTYPDRYTADALHAIARADSRETLLRGAEVPFHGADYWRAWELSWLDAAGVPRVASAEIVVPCDSPNLFESKSLKLYLGSFAMSRFEDESEVADAIRRDLSACAGAEVGVTLRGPASCNTRDAWRLPGISIDNEATRCDRYEITPELLAADASRPVSESLHSDLLRSLCPVTGQPDIGSVLVSYRGPKIDRESLLRYIVSYRQHPDFHEACVERMFVDLLQCCHPEQLTVFACYQRRGGIDINPFRSNFEAVAPSLHLWRQ